MKTVSLEEMKARQSPEMQHRINVRTDELRTELATMREIRKRLDITQVELATELGIGQEGISRLERRNDTLVSTLRKVVEAMGGDLRLIAELPDGGRVELSDFGHLPGVDQDHRKCPAGL
ncbi:MAG: helix-turn-helix transcriptional regulator [Boseongicola sp. SB0675_bin_26]|nr:helix-turn-helix transcriptional regulator [Boseongicola sp.]MYH59690.1 helix-turn-helix transcriptional regulator [Boseongicola sp. SB0675_bin_26]